LRKPTWSRPTESATSCASRGTCRCATHQYPGPVDALLPNQVSAAILVATNAYIRGRTGWTVKIYRAPKPHRSERFVHKEKARDPAQIVARAFELTDAITAGRKPRDEDL
jgi:hypothetical protein